MTKTNIKNYLTYKSIFSITLSGLLLALIIILNFVFDLFKGFGGFSIQVFLVIYALGIYLMPNIIVSFIFILIVPPILFALENGPYIISAPQVFLEYFIVFYIFFLMLGARLMNYYLNKKQSKWMEILIICIFYIICIIIKFFIHTIASVAYWNIPLIVSLSYNALSSLANSSITVILLIILSPIVILLNKKSKLNYSNYY